jgi:hypothetical protein
MAIRQDAIAATICSPTIPEWFALVEGISRAF